MRTILTQVSLFLLVAVLASGLIALLSWGGGRLISIAVTRSARPGFSSLKAQSWFLAGAMLLAMATSCVFCGAMFGRPAFGLGFGFLLPAALPRLLGWWHWKERRRLEKSALVFLYALQGLLRAGLSLPTALFHLARQMDSPFASALHSSLRRFEEGKALPTCLAQFRLKSDLRLTGICLRLLELTYRNGLAVVPMLERVIPVLESEREAEDRVLGVRKSTAGQIAISSAIPWVLWGCLSVFQPEMREQMIASGTLLPVFLLALLIEGIGVWVLWQVSAFV